MSQSTTDIERVVREVLAELAAAPAEGRAGSAERSGVRGQGSVTMAESRAPSPEVRSRVADELAIDSRMVTMAEIAGRLNGVRRVVVMRDAIVTPAVRDELLRRGVALACSDSSSRHSAAPVRLVIMIMGTEFDPSALAAGLAREGVTVEHAASDCVIAATDQLATETARPDTLGVLLTRHVAAGVCLANRLHGLRAVTGCDAPAVATAAAAVGANVLVADPQAGTFFQLKQMVAEFCRGGVRPCPGVFHARLA